MSGKTLLNPDRRRNAHHGSWTVSDSMVLHLVSFVILRFPGEEPRGHERRLAARALGSGGIVGRLRGFGRGWSSSNGAE